MFICRKFQLAGELQTLGLLSMGLDLFDIFPGLILYVQGVSVQKRDSVLARETDANETSRCFDFRTYGFLYLPHSPERCDSFALKSIYKITMAQYFHFYLMITTTGIVYMLNHKS